MSKSRDDLRTKRRRANRQKAWELDHASIFTCQRRHALVIEGAARRLGAALRDAANAPALDRSAMISALLANAGLAVLLKGDALPDESERHEEPATGEGLTAALELSDEIRRAITDPDETDPRRSG